MLSPAPTLLPSRALRCASRRVTGTKSTATHVTSPRKLSLSRRLLRLARAGLARASRGSLVRASRASRALGRTRTAVERGHLLLHLHLQLVLRGLRLHGRRLLRDSHRALLLGHVQLHFLLLLLLLERQDRLITLLLELVLRHRDVALALRLEHVHLRRVLVVEHLLLHVGLAVERLSRVLLLLRDRSSVEVRRVGSRTVPRVATVRRLRHVAHLRGRVARASVRRRGRIGRRGRVGSADGAHGNELTAT